MCSEYLIVIFIMLVCCVSLPTSPQRYCGPASLIGMDTASMVCMSTPLSWILSPSLYVLTWHLQRSRSFQQLRQLARRKRRKRSRTQINPRSHYPPSSSFPMKKEPLSKLTTQMLRSVIPDVLWIWFQLLTLESGKSTLMRVSTCCLILPPLRRRREEVGRNVASSRWRGQADLRRGR